MSKLVNQHLIAAIWALFIGSAAAFSMHSSAGEQTPEALVNSVTEQVLKVVRAEGDLLQEDPPAFYSLIQDILEPVVAFDYIAYGVMGDFAKGASDEQRAKFSEVFQSNLVNTYAKGMVVYKDLEVETQPLGEDLGERRRVSVVQKVLGGGSEHQVVYSLGKSKVDGQWKLVNVIFDGVNLGSTFRSQFAQAMKKLGDLDAVIANWESS